MSPIATLSRVSDQLRRSPVQLAKGVSAGGLNPKLFQDLVAGIESSCDAAGLGALEAIVGSQEETRVLVEYEGRRHRFKEVTEKEWLTPFLLERRSATPLTPGAGSFFAGSGRVEASCIA